MNKGKKGRKFGRKRDQRNAFMSHLAAALIQHGKIETTEARAKALRPYIEKLVSKSRKGSLASHRSLLELFTPAVAKKMREDIAPRFKERPGGYTRIIKRVPRKGDAAKRALIEFIDNAPSAS
jgi:large subunit ribosomal protein L17